MVQERKSNEVECTELEKEMMKLKSKGLEKKVEEENENISHLHQWIHSNIGNLDYGVDGKGLGLRRTLNKSTKKWSRGFLELYNAETDPEVKAVMRDMAKDLDRWIISATNSCCGYKKRGWWNYIKLIGFTDQKDSLMEMSFHIPNSNTQFVGDENRPPAQVFRDKIMSMADVGAGVEEAVVTFEGIAIQVKIAYSSFLD